MKNLLEEQQYLDILREIVDKGTVKDNRTGVGSKYIFGRNMRFSLRETIPVLTTKKIFWRGVVEELLFFLSGNTDTTLLEKKGVNIWKGNTRRDFLDKIGLKTLPEGDLGCSYSHQWRNFGGEHPNILETKGLKGFDQVKFVIDTLKSNPTDRRLVINGWAANQLSYMSLPPCHVMYIFSVDIEKQELNCQMTQRSCDFFLGVPFNIASLALMTNLFAKCCNLNPGEILWTGVDCHLYLDHLEAAREQLLRNPKPFPALKITKNISSLEDILQLSFDDLNLGGYKCYPSIKAPIAI